MPEEALMDMTGDPCIIYPLGSNTVTGTEEQGVETGKLWVDLLYYDSVGK